MTISSPFTGMKVKDQAGAKVMERVTCIAEMFLGQTDKYSLTICHGSDEEI